MRQKSSFRSAVHHHVSLLCLIFSLKFFMYAFMIRSNQTRTEIYQCLSGRMVAPIRGRVVLKHSESKTGQVILGYLTVRRLDPMDISRNLKMASYSMTTAWCSISSAEKNVVSSNWKVLSTINRFFIFFSDMRRHKILFSYHEVACWKYGLSYELIKDDDSWFLMS